MKPLCCKSHSGYFGDAEGYLYVLPEYQIYHNHESSRADIVVALLGALLWMLKELLC